MNRRHFISRMIPASIGLLMPGLFAGNILAAARISDEANTKWRLTPQQWRKRLTPEQYYILREAGTERPGSSPLDREIRVGIYHCAGCELPLFSSAAKYDSGTGWPSFYEPLPNAVSTRGDSSWFMSRTEVHCTRCRGHLGHVFDDGPPPTGLRYCMNGAALHFVPAKGST